MATDNVKLIEKLLSDMASGKDALAPCDDPEHKLSGDWQFLKPNSRYIDGKKETVFANDEALRGRLIHIQNLVDLRYENETIKTAYFINYLNNRNNYPAPSDASLSKAEDIELMKSRALETALSATVPSSMTGGSLASSVDLSKFDCNNSDIEYKDIPVEIAAIFLDMFGVKTKKADGVKVVDCDSIPKALNANMTTFLTNLAKIINSHPEILNSSLRNKYFNSTNNNWANSCDETLKSAFAQRSCLQPFVVKRKSSEGKNWDAVMKNIQLSTFYPVMPATQVKNWGNVIYGGDGSSSAATLPAAPAVAKDFYTAPKLSNDVSKVLRILMNNLKGNGVELDSTDKANLDAKLKTFNEMEEALLKDALVISQFNRISQDPSFDETGSKTIAEMQSLSKQYELKLRKYQKMQGGFEKVVFAILKNCSSI